MKKKLILAGVVVITGSLAWLLVNHYLEREDTLPPWSEKDLGNSARRQQEPPEPALAPVTHTNVVRLALGDLGSMGQEQGALSDLLAVHLTGVKGLELVERQRLADVLREQQLSLSSIVRATDAVRVGKLVGADWFLLGKSFAMGGTNQAVVRIVGVPTGVIRDITVVQEGKAITETAAGLADFVRRSRGAATNFTPQVFLAVGGFADVGVNTRQATFPNQLRAYLVNSFQQSRFTILEREVVSALLQEVELDLAGLTETRASGPPPPLRSAFWLVDGYFQSYETTGFEVELRIQLKRAFGTTTRFTLRGPPEELLPQAHSAIVQALAKTNVQLPGPTRRDEIDKQMQMGKELLTAAWGSLLGVSGLYPKDELNHPRRRHNIQEAQHSFETVLLLERDNLEAKFYLGACLADWTIGREEEALAYLREAAASKRLGEAFLAQQATSMINTIEERHSLGKWKNRQDGIGEPQSQESEKLLFGILRKIEDRWKNEHIWSGVYLGDFVNAFGTNAAKAADAMTQFWPKVKSQYPEFAPYILAAMLSNQVDTNSAIVAEFRESLTGWAERPEQVFKSENFFDSITRTAYTWSFQKNLFPLALEIMQAKRKASQHSAQISLGQKEGVRLGFAFVALKRWQDALTTFEQVGEAPVDMEYEGPWGDPLKPFLPAQAAANCREKLGLPPVRNPAHFAFGTPRACMHSPSTFVATDDALWLAIGGKLIRLGLDLHTNLQVTLPIGGNVPLTTLHVDREHVWVGTRGAGIIDYEKATGECRQIAEKDGLLLNEVACFWPQNHTLWIGFGRLDGSVVGNLGGLGKMDILTRRVSSFSQSLLARPVSRMTIDFDKSEDPPNGAPGHAVIALGGSRLDEVWMLVHPYGMRRYRVADNSWAPASDLPDSQVLGFVTDGERLVAGLRVEQIEVTLETKPAPGTDTNSLVRTNVIMTPSALERLKADKNSRYVLRGTSKGIGDLGGLGMYDPHECRWQMLVHTGNLPRPTTTVAVDGKDVWAAGWGYVAVVDSAQKAVRKICYIPSRTVDRLQIAGGYLWAQFDKHLYRVALSEIR